MAKRIRGKPGTNWDTPKTAKLSSDITPLAKTLIKSQSRAFGYKSIAEFIENLARKTITIPKRSPNGLSQLIIDALGNLSWEVEELAQELDLELERIDKILTFDVPAEMHELIALQTVLSKPDGSDYDIEELIEINQVGGQTNGERKSSKSNI